MKLNPDCTRAILLAVEKVCDMNQHFEYPKHASEIVGNFSNDEILYHARQCDFSGMFFKYSQGPDGNFSVLDLSPKGHEFLANIRDDGVWDKVKTVSSKVGSKSLESMYQIASRVITEIINHTLWPTS